MCIAIVEVQRRGVASPELITFNDEQALTERLSKLTTTDNVERLKIFRLAETLTKQVSFSST
jgi:hypothetical protein